MNNNQILDRIPNTMRKILVFLLKNSEIILFFYNWYFRLKNKKSYFKENKKRESLSIFDYEALAQPIPFYPIETQRDSNYYGYVQALKSYAGVDKVEAALEHGIYLGNRITTAEGYRTTKKVIAMSENRVESFKIHNINKPIVAIGPYIHYAEPLLKTDQFSDLKKSLGKVLLVMPVHAAKGFHVTFSHQLLIAYIQSIQAEYQTVMVCVHFRDILNNPQFVAPYLEKGYRIVCAGNEYDYNFVRRLKSIIMLADYVVSNSHGTNTGFCTYMRKPQTIVHDDSLVKKHNSYTPEVQKIRDEQVREIESAFAAYNSDITDEQMRIVDKYWGLSLVKSPKELYTLITRLNRI